MVWGARSGDFDNDGFDDVYITALNGNHLFRDLGTGKFADVTAKAGVSNPGFSRVPCGSTMTTMASWTCLSRTMLTGRWVRTRRVRSMGRVNRTARLRHTRDRARRCFTT